VSTRLRKREAKASDNPAPKKRAKGRQAEKPSPKKQKKAPVIVPGGDNSSSEDDIPLAARYLRRNTQLAESEASDKTHSPSQLLPVPSNQGAEPSNQTMEPTEGDTLTPPAAASAQTSTQPSHQPGGQASTPTQDKGKKAVRADGNPATQPPVGNKQSALPFLFTKSAR
jgi:hypothetical protein